MHSPRTSFGQLFTVLFLNCSSKLYFWTALYFEILCLIIALHRGCHQGNWINALAEDYWSPPPTLHNQPSCVPNIFSEAWYVFVHTLSFFLLYRKSSSCIQSVFPARIRQHWHRLWLWLFKCCCSSDLEKSISNLYQRVTTTLRWGLGRNINLNVNMFQSACWGN